MTPSGRVVPAGLLAVVSHDLKNPLSVILMNASVMAMSTNADDSKSRKHIESIKRAADLMSHLVGDLLDSASIEANKLVLQRQRLSVAAFVSDAVEAIQPVAVSRGLLLSHELPAAIPAIFGDPSVSVASLRT